VVRGYGVSLREYLSQEIHQSLDRPYLRRKYQGLPPNFQRRRDNGRYRDRLLASGRPPQEGATALYGAPRVS